MEYILESLPEYQQASKQLEQRMQSWKKEIEKMETTISSMESSLKNERILLTKELVEEREEEVALKREELNEYQQKRFGAEGDFIKQKQQLIQPVQDQVFNEMQKIGEQKKYDMILERSETTMVYSDDRHDLSEDVLRAITRTSKRPASQTADFTRDVDEETVLDEPYMSVQEADAKEDKIRERNSILAEKQALRAAKIRERDSIKNARAQAYKERREQLLRERARKRDSILEVRKKAKEGKENNNMPLLY